MISPMSLTRRAVLGTLAAASYNRVRGANDRVNIGFIGYGLIGAQHVHDFLRQDDANLTAVAEVYQPRLQQGLEAIRAKPGMNPRGHSDFRRLLDDKDVDAVCISTPDHWHALMSIMACAAGKDVFVEKPMTLFVREGRWMIDAARRHKRVVQVGTQQRSGPHYQTARRLIQQGHLGHITSVRMGAYRNVMPGFGRPEGPVPDGFDYDQWLGPAPKRPFSPHRGLYHFRWFWDYSGGQMTNQGAHDVDILLWILKQKGPLAVSSIGGRFALQDDGETPDTQDTLFRFPDSTATWSHREAAHGPVPPRGAYYYGTKGAMTITREGFDITGDLNRPPENAIPTFRGHPQGGPRAAQRPPEPWIPPQTMPGSVQQQFDLHTRNFLDCIKSRQQPIADVEDGHFTSTACHLANISLRLGRTLHWNPETEQIAGDAEATAMLERPYRAPWDNVLKSLLR
ncbi:MAG TPA: dehydrogenase [Solibacterales bacterium]|nr:dehydrogenase [Bryobacterales bacterium]